MGKAYCRRRVWERAQRGRAMAVDTPRYVSDSSDIGRRRYADGRVTDRDGRPIAAAARAGEPGAPPPRAEAGGARRVHRGRPGAGAACGAADGVGAFESVA